MEWKLRDLIKCPVFEPLIALLIKLAFQMLAVNLCKEENNARLPRHDVRVIEP